jgi:hypothetical protein
MSLANMAITLTLSTNATIVVPSITILPSVPSLVMKHDARRLEKTAKPRRTWRAVVVVAVEVVEDVAVVVAEAVVGEIEPLGMTTTPRTALTLAS